MATYSILALVAALIPTVALADIAGPARVIDGDTLEIGGERIRLHGIDAPERDQTCDAKRGKVSRCGLFATTALRDFIAGQEVTCKGNDRDRYGRLIAVCYVGRIDLNEQMVLSGGRRRIANSVWIM